MTPCTVVDKYQSFGETCCMMMMMMMMNIIIVIVITQEQQQHRGRQMVRSLPEGVLKIVFFFLQHLQFFLVFNQQHPGNSPIFEVRFSSKVRPPSGFRPKYCKHNLRALHGPLQ